MSSTQISTLEALELFIQLCNINKHLHTGGCQVMQRATLHFLVSLEESDQFNNNVFKHELEKKDVSIKRNLNISLVKINKYFNETCNVPSESILAVALINPRQKEASFEHKLTFVRIFDMNKQINQFYVIDSYKLKNESLEPKLSPVNGQEMKTQLTNFCFSNTNNSYGCWTNTRREAYQYICFNNRNVKFKEPTKEDFSRHCFSIHAKLFDISQPAKIFDHLQRLTQLSLKNSSQV